MIKEPGHYIKSVLIFYKTAKIFAGRVTENYCLVKLFTYVFIFTVTFVNRVLITKNNNNINVK